MMGKFKKFFRKKKTEKVWQFVDALPIILPVALGAVSIVAMIFLVTDNFKAVYIVPIGGLLAILLSALVLKYYPKRKIDIEIKSALVVMALLVLGWIGFNTLFSSQHVQVNRDPGIYAVAGLRLADQDNLKIQRTGILDGVEGMTESSAGFGNNASFPGTLYAQGAHLLPALLGLVGSFAGDAIMLHFNVVFGGLAILAVYAFARILMKDRWALVAALAFSASMPLIYFSRDSYTEPLTVIFVFSALTLLAIAAQRRSSVLWTLAGISAGVIGLIRVDATLTIVGLTGGLLTYLILSQKGERKQAVWNAVCFLVPLAVLLLVAWLDVYLLSRGYFDSLRSNIIPLYILLGVVVLIGIIVAAVSWKTTLLTKLDKLTKSWRGKTAVVFVVVISLILASRPLWYEAHKANLNPNALVAGIQQGMGLVVDGTRTYAEQSINWMVWYIGPILVLFSLIGFSIAVYRALHTRSIVWITSVAVIFAVAMLYFNKPSITPDQIWAARRFLPVIIPGIAVFGSLGLAYIYEKYGPTKKLFGLKLKNAVIVFATLAITFPLMVSYPLLFTKPYGSQLGQINDVCRAIDDKEKTLIVWAGTASLLVLRPVDEVCGIANYRNKDDIAMSDPQHLKDIARVAGEKGYHVVVGLFQDQLEMFSTKEQQKFSLVSSIRYVDYEQTLTRPPVRVAYTERSVVLADLSADGSLELFKK